MTVKKSDCGKMVTVHYDLGNEQGLLVEYERDNDYCKIFFFGEESSLRTESKTQILSVDHEVVTTKNL